MAFRADRKSSGPGLRPGVTPIDDIHGAGAPQDYEPDTTTGRLSAEAESSAPAAKRRRDMKRKSRTP